LQRINEVGAPGRDWVKNDEIKKALKRVLLNFLDA
jgi:hypothetical protein